MKKIMFLMMNFLAILSTIDCMNIEVRENLQTFIQSPLVDVVGVPNKTDAKFRVLPESIKPSFFGYNLISQEGQFWIGAPKAVGNFSVEHDTPKHNIKDAGGIFQCGVSGSSMFRSRESIPTTCNRISPDAFVEGDHFGLNIQEPRNARNLQACSATRLLGCLGGSYQPGFCFKSTDKGTTWSKPIDISGVKCSKKTIDIMFVLDGSGSVGEADFEKVKNWTTDVAHHFHEYDNNTQIGVVQYSHYDRLRHITRQLYIKTEIELGYHEPNEFKIAMNNTKLDGFTTHTGKALIKTIYDFKKSSRYDDPSNTKVIILVTDGKTHHSDRKDLGSTAEHLNNLGIITFAVGVGDADVDELKIITRNNTKRIYKVDGFSGLDSIVKQLQTEVISVTLEGSGTAVAASLNHQFGEIGFSSSTKNGRLLLGAVGAYDWSGTVAKYDNAGDKEADIPNYAEVQKVLPNRTKESYLGYSVTTGKYNGGSVDYAASGAPRYWMRGAVVVYKPTDSSALFDDAVTINPHESHQQFGSYFGGALLSMDLNNDGKDDLLVAAPLYIGIESDEGRVFVYITNSSNQNVRRWAAASYKPVELKGRGESGARFGTAMASAGDLNKDGFNDVIIGAPLTEDGRGAVYVYHGSADGIVSTPRQRIAASDVQGATLRYFGQSLQGGVDLDGNQYPDVAVGAPRSDTIAIFRSRPVATFATTVTFTKAKIDIFNCLEQTNRQCQNLTVCITISGEGVEPTATVDLKIRLDPTFGRLQFRTRADSSNGQLEQSFLNKTLTKGEQLCWPEKLYLKSKIDNYNDAATAILEYALTKEHTAKPLSSISDPSKPHSQQAEFTFEKKCAGKAICEYDLDLKSKLVLPDSKLESGADLTNGASRLVVSSETKETIIVQVNLTNTQQSAFDAQVVVEYSPQLSWNEITDVTSSYAKHPTCMQDRQPVVAGTNSSTKVIQYEYDEKRGNIMPKNHWCAFKIKLTWDKLKGNGNLSEVFINLNAGTLNSQNDSVDVNPANNVKKQEIPVVYKSNIDGKRLRGEDIVQLNVTETNSTISHVKEISKNFVQVRYEIFGRGYSNIPLSHISITYPAKFDDGLYLLYLYDYTCMTRETPDQKTKCTCDTSVVNRLGLATEKTGVNATTYNTTITPNPKPFTLSEIDCSNATTASKMCETLRCRVENLVESQKVSVEARFRVWIPTFNFIKNKTEKTVMKVDFNFNSEDSPLVLNKNGEKTITYVGQNEMIAELFRAPTEIQQSNQIWIYIVAGIAGVLLLLLAVFILYKCGFFKSKYAQKKEELEWQEADGPEEAT